MKTTTDYLCELRAVLGPQACIAWHGQMGMFGAFLTGDYEQAPYVIAGNEDALIQLAREKWEEEHGNQHVERLARERAG